MFDGAARWVEKADDTAILRSAYAPDEPKGHKGHESVPGPEVDSHPPLGRDEPGHDANHDKAYQEPVEQPRWQVPDFDPTAGGQCSRSLLSRHLCHRTAFCKYSLP